MPESQPPSPLRGHKASTSNRRYSSQESKGGERTAGGLRRSFVDFLGWLITIAWAASFIADMAMTRYDPPVSIHALMTIVAGAAFGGNLISKSKGKE